MEVKNLMTRNPATCTMDTSLHDVAQLMADNDCGLIPVTESADKKAPVGVITDRDIVLRTVAHNKNPLNMIAGEVMTDVAITTKPDTTVDDACKLMENNHIRRLVVVDGNGEITGMLAQADIARSASEEDTAHLVKEVSESKLKMTA